MTRALVVTDGSQADQSTFRLALEIAKTVPLREIGCLYLIPNSVPTVISMLPCLSAADGAIGLSLPHCVFEEPSVAMSSDAFVRLQESERKCRAEGINFRLTECAHHDWQRPLDKLLAQYELVCIRSCPETSLGEKWQSRVARYSLSTAERPTLFCPASYATTERVVAVCSDSSELLCLTRWGVAWAARLELPLAVYLAEAGAGLGHHRLECVRNLLRSSGLDFECETFVCPAYEFVRQRLETDLALTPHRLRWWAIRELLRPGLQRILDAAQGPILVLPHSYVQSADAVLPAEMEGFLATGN